MFDNPNDGPTGDIQIRCLADKGFSSFNTDVSLYNMTPKKPYYIVLTNRLSFLAALVVRTADYHYKRQL